MKKYFYTLLTSTIAIVSASAQVPSFLNYQAVARDAGGVIIASQPIYIRLTIHSTIPSGPTQYQETQTATTNQFGLFTLLVGSGTSLSGSISTVQWAVGYHYLQVEMKLNSGDPYIDMGTSQLVSVPYAFLADSALHANTQVFAGNGITVSHDTVNSVVDFVKLTNGTTIVDSARNIQIYSKDSIIVPKSGYYLVNYSAVGYDNNVYTSSSTSGDYSGTVRVYNTISHGLLGGAFNLAAFLIDNSGVSTYTFRFTQENIHDGFVTFLSAGDALKLTVIVNSSGSPAPKDTWGLSVQSFSMIRIK